MTQVVRIFLADDDPDDRLLFELSLRDLLPASEFYSFTNGQLLLAYLEDPTLQPDMIFLDLHMPLLNGAEIYQRLQDNPKWSMIPTVLLTGTDDGPRLAELYQIDPDRWHRKPRSAADLAQPLIKYLPENL